jgi:hypothetical protein
MLPKELMEHVGDTLHERFGRNSFVRNSGKPQKSDPCVADFRQYLSRINEEDAEEWAVFQNPLLRYTSPIF